MEADLIIIGSGQGGVPLASDMARQGQRVVIFERGAWGGTCVNYGCTPSKAFLASAHAATAPRRAAELGVHLPAQVDFPAVFPSVMERVRDMVDGWNSGVLQRLQEAGVHCVHAEASFVDRCTVQGGGLTVEAPRVVINSGKSPRVPDLPGLQGTPYVTYVDFWQLQALPRRSLVLGGGYTGMELGQGLARLGSQTHILDRNARPVAREEADVSRALQEALQKDGVQFHLETQAGRVDYADGEFALQLENGERLHGEALLVATGRTPNTAALNAGASGIALDERGHVRVDEHLRTTCEGVYAIGDVTGQPEFTHVSWEDHRRLEAIWRGEERTQRDRVLVYAFFTDPQVGRAGLTLEQAQAQGYRARAATLPLDSVARATETGRTQGFYRMVIDQDSDRILGATLVGAEAAELVHVFIRYMEAGLTWQTLAGAMHIHPTFAEGLPSLARLFGEED